MSDVDMSRFLLSSTREDGKKPWQAMSRMKMDLDEAAGQLTITVHFAGTDLEKRVDRLAGLHPDWKTLVVISSADDHAEEEKEALQGKGYTVEIKEVE